MKLTFQLVYVHKCVNAIAVTGVFSILVWGLHIDKCPTQIW